MGNSAKAIGFDGGNSGFTIDEDAITIEGESEDVTHLRDDYQKEMDAILADLGADAKARDITLKVYKKEPGVAQMAHCFDANYADMPITEKIRREFGAGTYVARVYVSGKLKRNINYNLAKPLSNTDKETKDETPATDMSALVLAIKQQGEMMARVMESVLKPQTEIDPLGQIEKLAAVMQKLVPQQQTASAADPNTMISMMTGMVEMAGKLAGLRGDGDGGAGGSNIYDVIRDVLSNGGLQSALQMMQQPRQQFLPPNKQSAPTQNQQGENMQQNTDPRVAALKSYVDQLVMQAKSNADVSVVGNYIISKMSPTQIEEVFSDPNLRETCAQLNPEAEIYWQWFNDLIEYLHYTVPENEEPAASQAKDSHAPNTQRPPDFSYGTSARTAGSVPNAEENGAVGEGGRNESGSEEVSGSADGEVSAKG